MQVDIWSDTRCPFCYIGKKKFEKALAKFPHSDKITVEWHSFELDPGMRTQKGVSIHDYLAKLKNISRETSVNMHGRLTEAAEKVGITYNFDTTVVANSFDAHRLIQMAKQKGLGDAAEERLFRAYFTEGKDISDHLTLIILGDEIGLNGKQVKQMLDGDEFAFEVRQDEKMAQAAGIGGVPYFVFNNRYAVSGAQEPEIFLKAMEKAWGEYEQSAVSA
jgi:predicted DsbA family dithiol-disulfide isomerase